MKTTAPRTDLDHYQWTDALDAACALLQATIDKRNAQSRASRLKAKVTRESRRQGELFGVAGREAVAVYPQIYHRTDVDEK